MISLGTQTDLNFELILNFISNDLPRLVSYDLVPMLLKIMTDPCKDSGGDLNKSLRRKVEELIREIVEKSLPKSQTIEISRGVRKPGYGPAQKRRKTNTPAGAPQGGKVSSVTLIHKPECGVCGQAFEKYPDVVKHLLTHKEAVCSAINCNLCNFNTFEPLALANHMKETHLLGKGAPITMRCKICQEEFYSESALKKHKKSYHRGSDIPKCPKCNVLFEFSSQLVTHLRFSATCGGNSRPVDPEASRYLKLPPARASLPPARAALPPARAALPPARAALPSARGAPLPSPSNQIPFPAPVNGASVTVSTLANSVPQPVTCVSLAGQGSNAANMVGNALLSALTLDPATGGNTVADSPVAVSQSSIPTVMPQNISENLIMDPTTGKPIPVAQFVEKRQAEIASGTEIMSAVVHTSKGYKCSVCNRSFTSLSMLVHHNEKAHLRKKTLSCTQCHLLFATFPELDSHFHRIHRKKNSSSSEVPANRGGFGCNNADNDTENKNDNGTDDRTEIKVDDETDVESGAKTLTKSAVTSLNVKTPTSSSDCQDIENSRKKDSNHPISETKNTTVLGVEKPEEDNCPQNRKRKAKFSDNKTSQSKSCPQELDHEIGKCKDSDKSLGSAQTKSKRGRTIAKVDYTEISK